MKRSLLLFVFTLIPAFFVSNAHGAKNDFSMVVQNSHGGTIKSFQFFRQDKYIVSIGSDKTIKIWTSDGRLVNTFVGHTARIECMAVNREGTFIVSGSTDGGDLTLRLWDVEGRMLKILDRGKAYNTVAFSPDGKMIIAGTTGSEGKQVLCFSITGEFLKKAELPSKIYSIDGLGFSPDGKKILAASGKDLWLLDAQTLAIVQTFPSLDSGITAMAISPDGTRIITASEDNVLRLLTLDGRLMHTFKGHTDRVWALAYAPDGKMIVSGSFDNTIRLWNSSGKQIRTINVNPLTVMCVRFTNDGKKIAAAGMTGDAHIGVNDDSGIGFWDLQGNHLETIKGVHGVVADACESPDGGVIASLAGDGIVYLWDPLGKMISSFKAHESESTHIAFANEGKFIVTLSFKEGLKIWDREGHLKGSFTSGKWFHNIAVSRDSKRIALINDKKIEILDTAGKLIMSLEGMDANANAVTFSPDGNHIAAAGWGKNIMIWKKDGTLLNKIDITNHAGHDISFTRDGSALICTINGFPFKGVRILKTNGEEINSFKIGSEDDRHYPVNIALSHDGSRVALTSNDRRVSIWDWKKGRRLNQMEGLEHVPLKVFFSGDDKMVYACMGAGMQIRRWKPESGVSDNLIAAAGEWIHYTPDGYWDGSPSSGKLVAMSRGLEAFGIDQFALKNNRPDLILESMGLGTKELIEHYYQQYLKRLRKSGMSESDLSGDLHVPEAVIRSVKQSGREVIVECLLSESESRLKKYNIYINDVPLFGAYGKELSGKSATVKDKIELTEGKNKIEVSCTNIKGAESYRALAYAEYKGKSKGDLYYIGFGVSNYKDSSLNLKYADKDAKDLADLYGSMKGKYSNVYVKTYLNEEVTVENIRSARDLLKNAKPEDTFVLFIAGHGKHDTDKQATYYYITHNADRDNLKGTCANFEIIEDLLQGIAPRNKLFLMDTCESGEADESIESSYYSAAGSRGMKARTTRALTVTGKSAPAKRAYLFQKDRYIYNDLQRRSGAIVFSSSRGGEFSYESDNIKNGYFTRAVIDGLKGRNLKMTNGLIMIDELKRFVSEKVARDTDNLQHPTVDRDNLYQKFGFPAK